ncbi:PD-(D/E)XK nuclease family protein [Stenotrophomonas sp. NRRL B-14846]|uniref:PDDEXK-like family protein n=1 Tax=Stenotrophomonas sp. NRRL B-14846 TaxID=3162882 RepID=UPI003D2D93ED
MPRKDRALELKIENLLVDPKLTELCEVLRTGDDILDLIDLPENGHSRILAWMFDPREGHGQGDQILRDLLLASWQMAQVEHCGLRKNGKTAAFFGRWSPSNLRTTSFGSAFTLREVIVNSKDRIDLAVFVPDQNFVVLIENKAGSSHTGNQLERYYNGWTEVTKKNPKLRRFDPVFLALDRNFDPDESQIHPMSHQWLHLGYEWLRNSADRADVGSGARERRRPPRCQLLQPPDRPLEECHCSQSGGARGGSQQPAWRSAPPPPWFQGEHAQPLDDGTKRHVGPAIHAAESRRCSDAQADARNRTSAAANPRQEHRDAAVQALLLLATEATGIHTRLGEVHAQCHR